jgi:16S rRNA (guanine1207-N2)-methyltransferase
MSHYFVEDNHLADDFRRFSYYYGAVPFTFTSNSGMFSPGHVDPASDRLIRSVPALQGSLLDLGCGYGVMGVVLAKVFGLTLTLADVNGRALRCAEENCRQNGVTAEVLQSDCFDAISGAFDTIVLNPPIHAGNAVIHKMFAQAPAHLLPGGAFYVVMLEKHGAKSAAKKLGGHFGGCEVLFQKKGEYVFVCRKG